mgnify:FL=1|jgi:hypothetical protein|tara:strand:- start:433 stop:2703 length:2271 start_codon:yes stop_codon:yes gene_type:complete
MAQGETFYSSIGGKVPGQFTVREEAVSSNSKTIDQQAFLNQNTGYVKLTSGINILSSNGKETFTGPATRFVLHGGAFKTDSGIRSGISFDKNGGFAKSDKAYNNYSGVTQGLGLGYRPMPGITSFNLQTYNTYGTLRQADVTFTVWSLEDLDQAEKLFLRPGYSAIIEFGHSVYLDNSGKKQTVGITQTLSDGMLFPENGDVKALEKAIENKRKSADGNYDAFFGIVTNFSYNFRNDGGYDCTLKIVSKGIVLDSIKNGEVSDGITFSTSQKEAKDTSKQRYKSAFHFLLHSIQEFSKKTDSLKSNEFKATLDNILQYSQENNQKFELNCTTPAFENFTALYSTLGEIGDVWYRPTYTKNTAPLVFVPMSFVLDLFNNLGTIYPVNERDKPIISFSTKKGNRYRTFPNHFSTNPISVLLPKTAKFNHPEEDGVSYHWTNNKINNLMKTYAEANGGTNQILNMFVSTKLIMGLLDKVYDVQNFNTTFIDFINLFLTEVNDCLSNITKLTLYFNETEDKYEVVDAHETSKGLDSVRLNLTGLKSMVTNLSVSSRISSNTAAQLSIAAQAGTDTYLDNVSHIRNWNKGAVDRFMKTKVTNPEDCIEQDFVLVDKTTTRISSSKVYTVNEYLIHGNKAQLASDVYKFWKGLNRDEDPRYSVEDQNGIQQTLRKFNLLEYEFWLLQDKLTEIPIPVELSFDTVGISGMKIGQSFKVNKGILLPKYDKYGYIITSLGHRIDTNNQWITSVGSQFFDVDNKIK